ncbi:hypothetical protein [Mucilaginibacter pedocola]|uniref:Lipocalin-like domain-containing protein n=1 Tax=Mucilaginibacter pedocola TaxID=1792845 RepID=A0A1S9PD20_9SPHI|nr:hypothetical protein [Mucilaginibacter pedocola]OOQ58882.1 hypothetical protein BC343_09575 [Mucilaginibacter pedocola]
MKKALLLATLIIALASCKKDETPNNNSGLFAKWELAFRYGGWAPAQRVTNSGDFYEFKRDSTYVRYIDNKVTASGRFSIHINETRDTLKFGTIKFTNPESTEAWAQTPNSITIGTSIADGPSYEYRKVNSKW